MSAAAAGQGEHKSYAPLRLNTGTDETQGRDETIEQEVLDSPRNLNYTGGANSEKRVFASKLGEVEMSPQSASACLGMAKAIEILGVMESTGACSVEKDSVYGAALAIPQIARSALWPKSMCCLTWRAYLFLAINYVVQTMFVYYIYDSQTNMNPFGGQMHLCDFASHVSECPNKPNCHGPGGKEFYNPGSLYPYDIWNTRKFMKASLQSLFPHITDEIADKVDPGEYGVEGYYCRLICIFVFMVAIADEFQNIRDLFKLFYYLPTSEASWIHYAVPTWATKQHVKVVHGVGELDFVRFSVNGMPLRWKIVNVFCLLIPKIFIWRMLSMAGVHFIMETAAMVDQIVNTTALSFVFTLDELFFDRLTTQASKHIMSSLQEFSLSDDSEVEAESDQDALNRYNAQEMTWTFSSRDWWLLPRRLFWAVVLMMVFTGEYYLHNCTRTEDGSWVSVEMFYPVDAHLDAWCFVTKFFSLPFSNEVSRSFWSMPEGSGQ